MKSGAIVLLVLLATGMPPPAPAAPESLHGGRVDWARLITPDRNWNIHSDRDPDLADFIRKNTNLNIASTRYSADPSDLNQLCNYPFLYAKDLTLVRNREHLANIREYLARGGFICVDACGTPNITPNMLAYFRDNRDLFMRMFPGAEVRQLPETHGIYTCYFKVREADIYTPDMGKLERKQYEGLFGVFVGERMVGLISMYSLQCGWPQTPKRTPGCMKLILNAYVYAMTAAPEKATAPAADTAAPAGR